MSAAVRRVPGDPRIALAIATLGWRSPRIRTLAGGPTNASFLVRAGDRACVIRLAGADAADLGVHAASELAIQRLAVAAGLAPEILLAWPDRGVLVTRHAPGRRPGARELRDAVFLARVGRWFRALHALPPPRGLPVVDIGERAAGYIARLRAARDSPSLAAIASRLERRRGGLPALSEPAPCHHDMHRRNLAITGDAILAVDWEYAGPGDPAADLAAFLRYQGLDARRAAALFAGYGAGAPRARVQALAWIFDCLWYGWLGAAALRGLAVDGRARATLARRLRA